MTENPIIQKQKDYEKWRDTQQVLFSPKEIEEFREKIKQEINEVTMNLRITNLDLQEELRILPFLKEKLSEISDRLQVLELRFNAVAEEVK